MKRACLAALLVAIAPFAQAQFWKSWKHPGMSLVTATAMSSAAPLYFEPLQFNGFSWCDGGLWGNNPSIFAAVQARKLWPMADYSLIDIACPDRVSMDAPGNGGLVSIAKYIVPMFINSGENAGMEGAKELVHRYSPIHPLLFRASEDIGDASRTNLEALKRCIDSDRETYLDAVLFGLK